ncbi:hypothetical protein [Corynebacterium vitaeruminis]|nr:hypothetical protein [Corynebacterium vitaeruminis]
MAILAGTMIVAAAIRHNESDYIDCSGLGLDANDERVRVTSIYTDPSDPTSEPVAGVSLRQQAGTGRSASYYNVYARGIDTSRPVGIVYRLHGDGAEEYYEPGGVIACSAALAAAENKILVVPLSPDHRGEVTWWENIPRSISFLKSVDQAINYSFDLDPSDKWWTGYSGGAELLSYGLIPEEPTLAGRGALMMGGGGANSDQETSATDEQKENLKLVWATGIEDDGTDPESTFDAKSAATKGSYKFKELGFKQVDLQLIEGKNHFDLPELSLLDQFLN